MSDYYELLRRSSRAQRLFTAAPMDSAVAIDVTPWSEAQLPNEVPAYDQAAAAHSADGDARARQTAPRPEPEFKSDVRIRETIAPTAARRFLARVSTPERLRRLLLPKAEPELIAIAQEEQVKLIQRVFLTDTRGPKLIVFSGINRGDGCSRICAESAVTLSHQVSGTVCLVDADVRCPSLHRIFGLENNAGFSEATNQARRIREYAQPVRANGNLYVLTAGLSCSSAPYMLLNSEVLSKRINELREAFDFVLIDAPPLVSFADTTKLGPLADGVVLVMEANSTRREAAKQAKEHLEAAHCKIVAAVLNRRTFPVPEAIYRSI